ncbi:amino acid ABC transporter substrate-binding protein [Microvirga massiliensis]|uniref:amino acid ABC transporter substrate-binding protein n=1 Tax=Microvirga massiliensis TaxID=1033741 RepID=UPI00062BE97F
MCGRFATLLAGVSLLAATLVVAPALAQQASPSGRLASVKAKGSVRCGVNPGLAGFSFADSSGQWRGLDVDVCRAVAAAVFGDATKVQYVPLSAKDRFTALQSGEIDLLARNASWTLSRNTQLGINFVATNFYDGQAFMVKSASGVKSVNELNGASVCVIQGTSTEKTLADYFGSRGMKYETIAFADANVVAEAYLKGRCDAMTSDQSQLTAVRSQFPDPKAHVILPEIITKEPLSPAVRNGDDEWANVVRWSFVAMVEAEEIGLNSDNVRQMMASSTDPAIQRFTGKSDNFGSMLGLDKEWAVNIVEQVGNYAESYDRNVKPIGLERGVNRLWKDGGYLITPPMR